MKLGSFRMRNRARSVAATGMASPNLDIPSSVVSQLVAVPQATDNTGALPPKLDFAAGAKAFRRSRLKASIWRAFVVSCIITGVVFGLLASLGLYLNHRYEGRALPYTYVGGVSVGGLSEAEIKSYLDDRSKDVVITLQDGGLTRQVTPKELGVVFDTGAAAKTAMHGDMQLLSYLVKKTVEVPVTVNGRYVEGYLNAKIHNLQSKPADASIVKERGKIVLRPEQVGFMTDPAFVQRAIVSALAGMSDPVINVNAVTLKPRIYSAQLQDDLERTQALLKTNINVRVGASANKPSEKQKYQWMQLKNSTFDGTPQVSFDKGAVRSYIADIARRYTAEGQPVTYDIERATDQLVAALASGSSATIDLQKNSTAALQPAQ